MFSKCFHRHFEYQKSRLFKRLFDILYTIRTRLYYFPNGIKSALFGPYLQVQLHKNTLFSYAYTKNVFKNVFTEIDFDAIIVCNEKRIPSLKMGLFFHLPINYIFTFVSNRIQCEFIRFFSTIQSLK